MRLPGLALHAHTLRWHRLPVTSGEAAVFYFGRELSRLTDSLSEWSGRPVSQKMIGESIERYNEAALVFEGLRERLHSVGAMGGAARLQTLYNNAITRPLNETREMLKQAAREPQSPSTDNGGVPILAFCRRPISKSCHDKAGAVRRSGG